MMVGSASSMCAASTRSRPVTSMYVSTKASSTLFDSALRDPWSTSMTPILGSLCRATPVA
eukprot:scaffold1782_cov414-Prasinococcus_capsulatus_cf.AAC.27